MVFILILFSACGKKSDLTYSENTSGNFPAEEAVSFAQLKSDILTPHCIRCHSSASTEAGISSWVVPGNPEGSPLYQTTKDGSMPKDSGPLTTRDLEEIRNYITNAQAETPTPTPTPDAVTFAQIKSEILTPYRCTSCHSMSTESATARYINTTTPERSSLYTTVKDGSMPRGGSDVTPEKQALLLQYIKDYAASH